MKRLALSAFVATSISFACIFQSHSALAADASMVADVSLTPAGDFKAKSEEVKGHALLMGDTVTAENIVVGLTNLKTGLSLRDKHAKEKYLDIAKYPDAILVKAIGKGGKGKGRIRFRGIEKDVDGTYKIEGNFVRADFPIKLSDFGISNVKYMGVGVDDDVKVHITVPIQKH